MDEERIRSLQNPRVKNLVKLQDSGHRRRQGLYLIEGQREISRALKGGAPLRELFFCDEFFTRGGEDELIADVATAGVAPVHLAREAFEKASGRENPDGLLAIAEMQPRTLEGLSLPGNPLILIVEQVEKPGNLGAIVRSAGAAGAHAVIVTDPVADIYNPHVVRSSQGVCFDMPILVAEKQAVRLWLSRHSIIPVATTPDAKRNFWDVNMSGPVALLLGSERDGLSPFWLDSGTIPVRIPMQGLADSLNVSAAAAVFLFEAVRQRSVRR